MAGFNFNIFSFGQEYDKVQSESGLKKSLGVVKGILKRIDMYYVVTLIVLMGAGYGTYLYFSQDMNIHTLEDQRDALLLDRAEKEREIEEKKLAVSRFVKDMNARNKSFIPTKDNFGVYKLIIELDKLKKVFSFDYKLQDNEKDITRRYKYYEVTFVIDYSSIESFKTIVKNLTKDYYMGFEEGTYTQGKFTLKYKVYARTKESK